MPVDVITISRALKPASKISTYQDKEGYLLPLTDSTNWHDIYEYNVDEETGEILTPKSAKYWHIKVRRSVEPSTEKKV